MGARAELSRHPRFLSPSLPQMCTALCMYPSLCVDGDGISTARSYHTCIRSTSRRTQSKRDDLHLCPRQCPFHSRSQILAFCPLSMNGLIWERHDYKYIQAVYDLTLAKRVPRAGDSVYIACSSFETCQPLTFSRCFFIMIVGYLSLLFALLEFAKCENGNHLILGMNPREERQEAIS